MHPLKVFTVLLVSGFLVWGVLQTAAAGQPSSPGNNSLERIEVDSIEAPSPSAGISLQKTVADGLILEFITPEFHIEQDLSNGQPCQVIQIDSFGMNDTPGEPASAHKRGAGGNSACWRASSRSDKSRPGSTGRTLSALPTRDTGRKCGSFGQPTSSQPTGFACRSNLARTNFYLQNR